MATNAFTLEEVKSAVEIARMYASGDNSQFFDFTLQNGELDINYREPLARHCLVYDHTTICITLGGLLEYLKQAFLHQGIDVDFSFNLEGFDVYQNKQGLVRLNKTAAPALADYKISKDALLNRVTDRREYLVDETLSDVDVEELNRYLKHSQMQKFVAAEQPILEFFAKCDSLVWTSKKLALDIMNSVTFDEPPSKRGLPWRNLGLKKSETLPIKLIQKLPGLFGLFSKLGAEKEMRKSQNKLWQSNKSFVVFSFDKDISIEQKTLASMQMMHTLLLLVEKGYSFQPSTNSTEVLNIPVKPQINIQTKAQINISDVAKEIETVRQQLNLANEEVNWILRIGKAPSAFPQECRTNRLDVEDLLKF